MAIYEIRKPRKGKLLKVLWVIVGILLCAAAAILGLFALIAVGFAWWLIAIVLFIGALGALFLAALAFTYKPEKETTPGQAERVQLHAVEVRPLAPANRTYAGWQECHTAAMVAQCRKGK